MPRYQLACVIAVATLLIVGVPYGVFAARMLRERENGVRYGRNER